jgi:hypothetical protein
VLPVIAAVLTGLTRLAIYSDGERSPGLRREDVLVLARLQGLRELWLADTMSFLEEVWDEQDVVTHAGCWRH